MAKVSGELFSEPRFMTTLYVEQVCLKIGHSPQQAIFSRKVMEDDGKVQFDRLGGVVFRTHAFKTHECSVDGMGEVHTYLRTSAGIADDQLSGSHGHPWAIKTPHLYDGY